MAKRGTALRAARIFLLVALAAVFWGVLGGIAHAAVIDTESDVFFEGNCGICHAKIADSKSSEIRFSHAAHLAFACSSCHGHGNPHSKAPGTTAIPQMKDCFNCHNLRHGPLGELATGKCEDCHLKPKQNLRPSFHTYDWAGKPHVQPSLKEMNSKCMMCHNQAWCDDCHIKDGVAWRAKSYKYNSGTGCLACHGNPYLQKTSLYGPKSYFIEGIDQTAHRDLACGECHVDFKYADTPDATNIWRVNAGLACQGCHDHEKQSPVYAKSAHGKALAAGKYKSATCASCHGGHKIELLTAENGGTAAARRRLRASAKDSCGQNGCHEDYYATYNDYYHGAAYKAGAKDAPACWDCHGAHDVLPKGDPKSKIYAGNLAKSCNAEIDGVSCHNQHKDATETFTEQAAKMIHFKDQARKDNWLVKMVAKVTGWL